MYEHWIETDISNLPSVEPISANIFTQDNESDLVGLKVFENGREKPLSGTIKANVIRANGTTIEVTGSLDGNRAWIVLPSSAYAYVGKIGIYFRIESSGVITTLGGMESYVRPSIVGTTIS